LARFAEILVDLALEHPELCCGGKELESLKDQVEGCFGIA